jgi:hypothetical protein
MKLSKRTVKALPIPKENEYKPRKIMSEKSSRKKMDIEYDHDEEQQVVLFQGTSNFGLTFFDSDECTNKFTPDPLYRDVNLVSSSQKKAFLKFICELMVCHSVPPVEIRKRINDPEFLAKAYQYLKQLCSQNMITQQ